jgi:hypothetical protein
VQLQKAQPAACSLKPDQLKEAPELFGFHLGMTLDQVKARSALIQFGPAIVRRHQNLNQSTLRAAI